MSARDGFLLADKGAGVTSFQVVAHLRRVLRVSKVGHGGTLDPMATGLLPILLGAATKLAPYLLIQDKEYVATVRLGVETDTLDATGRVTGTRPVPDLSAATLRDALARFVGEVDQVPPMFSALHVAGRRLHELARAGVEVERRPRRVRIDAVDLMEWASPLLSVRVACGTGTYVRSLAADLGRALGCGACLAVLRRTRLGPFRLDEAVPWETVRHGAPAALWAAVRPADRAILHLPAVRLGAASIARLREGRRASWSGSDADGGALPAGVCRLYADGEFCGIGEAGPDGIRPVRLFHASDPRPGALPG